MYDDLDWRARSAGTSSEIAALAALRTNVMIADAAMNITYMNPALTRFMQEAEADLKAELPRFDAAKLIGSNIDIFHKDPSHQRRMLAALDKPHEATIRVGKRVFDLLVTPLTAADQRIGFVVEWADARSACSTSTTRLRSPPSAARRRSSSSTPTAPS